MLIALLILVYFPFFLLTSLVRGGVGGRGGEGEGAAWWRCMWRSAFDDSGRGGAGGAYPREG